MMYKNTVNKTNKTAYTEQIATEIRSELTGHMCRWSGESVIRSQLQPGVDAGSPTRPSL